MTIRNPSDAEDAPLREPFFKGWPRGGKSMGRDWRRTFHHGCGHKKYGKHRTLRAHRGR